MLQQPAFQPHLRAETIPGQGVVLLGERGHTVLNGRLMELVVPLIDGSRSTAEIVGALAGRVSAAEVFYTLDSLEGRGLLAEGLPEPLRAAGAFFSASGLNPAAALAALAENPVSVTAVGCVDAGPFVDLLQELGVRVESGAARSVVLADDYLRPEPRERNRRALADGSSWMMIKPVGQEFLIGPLFVPGQTGCWQCLQDRYAANRQVESFLMACRGEADPPVLIAGSNAATLRAGLGIAAAEVARWVAQGSRHALAGKILSLDSTDWSRGMHTLTRRPQCVECGAPQPAPEPPALQRRAISYRRDGGFRTMSPEETLQRCEAQISPLTGVVTGLRTETEGHRHLHVYVSGRSFARRYDSVQSLKNSVRGGSAGKGLTDAQARASAVCEAIERHSALFQGDEPRHLAARSEVDPETHLHPNACMLFSERQYARRVETNALQLRFGLVPEPFDETAPVEWSPVWSLTEGRFKHLPTEYLYFRYVHPDGSTKPRGTFADSNGCAAGNTLEEAVLQGLLEVIERDAVALWWYNRLRRPPVDLASSTDPLVRDLLRIYDELDREVAVIDLTNDMRVPVYAAISHRRNRQPEQLIVGYGCHLEPQLALSRALSEMNQMLGPAHRQERGDPYASGRDEVVWWLTRATRENQPYMTPDPDAPPAPSCNLDAPIEDLFQAIETCRQRLEACGLELLVLDQTRPDTGMNAVKVIVPGARPFWGRYAPGRLYDVPVKLGWRREPCPEEELNPIPFFL